ncbi:glycosyltransferase family 4 protein [Streptomyces sp. GC420]|uniref:glycosyltransferase family 4 protein n=1 Tax=Streptomyces sp. GC420 TaxID=2697568 RepID=UPI001414F437|nr:glycosyltransferase family 4 protein [Streptomyces sp. GC420]NBM16473.1 glycosyltransferase [Streptomyces sp. GC420]
MTSSAPQQGDSSRVRDLRIAIVHSFYSSATPSGENQAVADQMAALDRAGLKPHLVAAHTDRLSRSPLYPLRAAVTVGSGRGHSPEADLRRLRPDVVHVHNLFPNFGSAWLSNWDGPIIATVHNYRPLCAAATLYRKGATCTLCPDGDRWAGLRNGCYRQSRTATAPLAWAGRHGAPANPLLRRADRIVVLSEASRQTYVRAGIEPGRLVLVPNFTSDAASPKGVGSGRRHDRVDAPWVFAGRLTPEKGLMELLVRWPASERLDVVGDGPLLEDCRRAAPRAVRFLGAVQYSELRERLPSWRGLVFPSRCPEGAPLIYPEALAAGLPVLAFPGSAVADSVREQGTGMVVGWHEPLDAALSRAADHFHSLRPHCRSVFLRHYTERIWVNRIANVYSDALAHHAAVREVPSGGGPRVPEMEPRW